MRNRHERAISDDARNSELSGSNEAMLIVSVLTSTLLSSLRYSNTLTTIFMRLATLVAGAARFNFTADAGFTGWSSEDVPANTTMSSDVVILEMDVRIPFSISRTDVDSTIAFPVTQTIALVNELVASGIDGVAEGDIFMQVIAGEEGWILI